MIVVIKMVVVVLDALSIIIIAGMVPMVIVLWVMRIIRVPVIVSQPFRVAVVITVACPSDNIIVILLLYPQPRRPELWLFAY